jgi:PKD repeat protein
MKKALFLASFLWISFGIYSQTWVGIATQTPSKAGVKLVSSTVNQSIIKFSLNGYYSNSITIGGNAMTNVSVDGSTAMLEAGSPELPKLTASLIIPDKGEMTTQIISSSYIDYQNISIAPSKGNLTRDIDPSTVPYTFGASYSENTFYPGKLAELKDPYILRDYRGEAVQVYPFQYNPVTKVLRVYTEIIVKVSKSNPTGLNELTRTKAFTKVDEEFSKIYNSHFLNYGNSKYTPLEEHGKMLIICYDSYMSAMQPFVNWKNDEGIPTEMISVTAAGGTAAAIKTYVSNYYSTNGLTFLLLVGDAAQCPTYVSTAGDSDPSYGYITGSDQYQEIFVGRFSAESIANVTTQVNRTIRYEKEPSTTPGKFNHCVGIGSNVATAGDDNEFDWQHQRNILNDLTSYTYTTRAELFDGSQGGTDVSGDATAAQLTTEVNNGSGIITYCGHGADNSFVTTGFSSTNVSALTNTTLWPFIWSVACVNGNFASQTCFAEAWLRATSGGQPSGAVATLMSTINQSWNPPMEGQDEMVDLLVESYSNNIKRTFGGLSVNGIFKMNDTYADFDMTDTWTIFGDPSLMVRTANPLSMTVTHDGSVPVGTTQLLVNSNVEGAFVCLTINDQIIGTGTISGGNATITFNALTTLDSITVVATAYNYIPYIGNVEVVNVTLPLDAQIMTIVSPKSSYNCDNLTVTPKIVLKNMGINTLTGATISYSFDSAPVSTLNWNGNLTSMQSDTISLDPVLLTAGSHSYTASVSYPNGGTDGNTANDSKTKTISVNALTVTADFAADNTMFCNFPATVNFTNFSANATSYNWNFGDGTNSSDSDPVHIFDSLGVYSISLISDAGECGSASDQELAYITVGALPPAVVSDYNCSPAVLELSATGTGTMNWYDAASGGNLIYTGTNYTTPFLSASETYYVENVEANTPVFGGMLTNAGTGQNYNQATERCLVFDCFKPATLVSVKVYASGAADRTIQLRDNAGLVLQTKTITIPDGESTVILNFDIPVGTGLQLFGLANCNLYRNSGTFAYPYQVSDILSITASNSSTPTGNYYFFYNWEVKETDCISARIPVTAGINPEAVAQFVCTNSVALSYNFTNTSLNMDSCLWNFGDGNISSITNPSHVFSTEGIYNVTLIVYNDCDSDTISQQITVLPGSVNEITQENLMVIYPNPVSEGATITIRTNFTGESFLYVYNINGQLVEKMIVRKGISIINTEKLKQGIYYLKLMNNTTSVTRKIVIAGS